MSKYKTIRVGDPKPVNVEIREDGSIAFQIDFAADRDRLLLGFGNNGFPVHVETVQDMVSTEYDIRHRIVIEMQSNE